MSGYSGTPLARKLGIKPGYCIRLLNRPDHYFDLFEEWPEDVEIAKGEESPKDLIHFFTKDAAEFLSILPQLRSEIKSNGMIWVSWPKKASKVPTDMSENVIRAYALSIGLVDVKVCAVDAVWSGLKLVIPVKLRGEKSNRGKGEKSINRIE